MIEKITKTLIIFNILALLLLQGCDKKEDSRQTTSAADRPSATQTEQKEKKFDIEKVRKELSLNGKKFSLPCRPRDFGKNYYLDGKDNVVKVKGKDGAVEGLCIGMHTKNGKGSVLDNRITIFVKNEKTKKYEDMSVYCICVEEKNRKNFNFQVDSINFDSTKEEVTERFGEPSKKLTIDEKPESVTYEYKNNKGRLEVEFDGNRISEIIFSYQ